MSKISVNLKGSAIRVKFKEQIDKEFGKKNFTKEQAKASAEKAGLSETEFKSIYTHVLRHFKVDKNTFCFGDVPVEVKEDKKEKKKVLQKDLDVINEPVEDTQKKYDDIAKKVKKKYNTIIKVEPKAVKPKVVKSASVSKVSDSTLSLIPKKDPQYVTWGHFKDIQTILQRKIFYPVFITGLSGNGKTCMIHEVCAKLKRDLVRINITVETDEDDLLGGFRLVDGETVWQD